MQATRTKRRVASRVRQELLPYHSGSPQVWLVQVYGVCAVPDYEQDRAVCVEFGPSGGFLGGQYGGGVFRR